MTRRGRTPPLGRGRLRSLAALRRAVCVATPARRGDAPLDAARRTISRRAWPSWRSRPCARLRRRSRRGAWPRRSGPGSLLRDGGRVLVDVRFERGRSAGVDELREAGAQDRPRQPPLPDGHRAVAPGRPARGRRRRRGGRRSPRCSRRSSAASCRAPAAGHLRGRRTARTPPRLAPTSTSTAAGVTVGILSDSFDRDSAAPGRDAAEDVASGDLPGPGNPCGHRSPVDVLDDLRRRAERRRGAGDGADRPRPGPGRRRSPSQPPSTANSASPTTSGRSAAGRAPT